MRIIPSPRMYLFKPMSRMRKKEKALIGGKGKDKEEEKGNEGKQKITEMAVQYVKSTGTGKGLGFP